METWCVENWLIRDTINPLSNAFAMAFNQIRDFLCLGFAAFGNLTGFSESLTTSASTDAASMLESAGRFFAGLTMRQPCHSQA